MNTLRFTICIACYFALFFAFEYVNAQQMTSGSWKSIVRFGLRPSVLAFFALSPILVWGFNKELYEFIGSRFWHAGALMAAIEMAAYFLASLLFYRNMPTVTECAALMLVASGVLVGTIGAQ